MLSSRRVKLCGVLSRRVHVVSCQIVSSLLMDELSSDKHFIHDNCSFVLVRLCCEIHHRLSRGPGSH